MLKLARVLEFFMLSSGQILKNQSNKNKFGTLINTSLHIKFGLKTPNCTLTASAGRKLGGHKIANTSLSSSSTATIFLIERLKMVLSFETYNLNVPQT